MRPDDQQLDDDLQLMRDYRGGSRRGYALVASGPLVGLWGCCHFALDRTHYSAAVEYGFYLVAILLAGVGLWQLRRAAVLRAVALERATRPPGR